MKLYGIFDKVSEEWIDVAIYKTDAALIRQLALGGFFKNVRKDDVDIHYLGDFEDLQPKGTLNVDEILETLSIENKAKQTEKKPEDAAKDIIEGKGLKAKEE